MAHDLPSQGVMCKVIPVPLVSAANLDASFYMLTKYGRRPPFLVGHCVRLKSGPSNRRMVTAALNRPGVKFPSKGGTPVFRGDIGGTAWGAK